MASKIFKIIIAIIVVAAIGGAVYYFGYKKDGASTVAGLVSSRTGASQGLQSNTTVGEGSTGSQVVAILRNLSVIKLDDSVFRNPAFALLTDISISLPPVTNQGRRNPFAPVGAGDIAIPTTTTTPGTGTIPTGGPSF